MISGLNTQNTVLSVAGAILVGVLAALVAGALGLVTRALTPRPLRHRVRIRAQVGVRRPRREYLLTKSM